MKIVEMKINGINNPVGFAFDYVLCSWKVKDAIGKKQKYVCIEVSESEAFQEIVYKKEGANLKQNGECLEIQLKPRTTYYYRVTVQTDAGESETSNIQYFETGKMNENWKGKWIATQKEDTYHPILERKFKTEKAIKKARIYMTGVGLFETYLDGEKIGTEYLVPYINAYETGIQIITLPITKDKLKENEEHSWSVLLGKGWYMGTFGLELKNQNWGNRMAAIGELHLEYEDGTEEIIGTDDTWNYYGSDIEDSGIYFGEIVNHLLWEEKANPLKKVEVLEQPEKYEETRYLAVNHLKDRLSLPVMVKEILEPVRILHTPKGETVLDMGQNFAGYLEFDANFPAGTKIVLDFGEILQNGNFYNGNYRNAKSQFVYISDGREEQVRPHFTFFGFRYVRVTGWSGECDKKSFRGCVVYSDIQRTGYIETSNAKINRLYENTIWGLKSNFIDIPTDCPQRDERLGWTGDAQVFAPTASYHMDTRAFFHKFIKDLRDEQLMSNGATPNMFPNLGHREDAKSVWGDIATLLPATLYRFYGNKEEMEYAYSLMKEWVDYIDRLDGMGREKKYLFDNGDTFGDWLALDGATPCSMKGGTDDDYISSVYYYHSVQIVRKIAEQLQKEEDVKYYTSLEEKIKKAVLNEYFSPTGRLTIDTQAAYVIALKFQTYIDREKLIQQFKNRLKKDMYQIKCGFVGAPLLCTTLAEIGEYELAYDFLLKEGFPSWLYSVNLGATTIWERWNSVLPDGTMNPSGMNSLNHYAYGSVMEFVYAYVAGIRPMEVGYTKAMIAPHPDARIREIKCRYNSVSGEYCCNWKIEESGMLKIHIEIPFQCEAVVQLPGYEIEEIELEMGSYDFHYMPRYDFRKPYTKETTLDRLSKDRNAIAILEKYVPAYAALVKGDDSEMKSNTIEDITKMFWIPYEEEKLNRAIRELENLNVCE